MKRHEQDGMLLVLKENIDLLLGQMLNFLDVERLRKGEMIYRHDSYVDLARVARRKSDLFAPIASKKRISIDVNAGERVLVRIDPQALDRIFNNLLDNAVRYIQEGRRITIDVYREQGRALLRIADNGPGLRADTLEHMFEPYYLLSMKKSGQQGIGVGLSIVKKILDGINATVAVESGEGSGTCFIISFEEADPGKTGEILEEDFEVPPIHTYRKVEEHDVAGGKYSLLVVDDNIRLLEFIRASLSESFNVFLARNASEALAKLKIIPRPDVIVSDIMMDDMDGFEFLSSIATKERFSDIPFIFLTALSGEKEKLRGLSLGAVDYIEKPFSIDTLRAKIESLITLRDRQRRQDREHLHDSIIGLLSGSGPGTGETTDSEFGRLCKKFRIAGRECEIIQMIVGRMVNKEIASSLHISQRAVEYDISKIFRKCGVRNKRELLDIFDSAR
jgi:CheY-like chemotaxis protein/DNA-binding CsgD family transcriptional regulator